MQQTTAARPDAITKTFGSVTITASRTVEGGYAINTMVGPERISALCSTTADRKLYQHRYKQIRDLALQGYTVEQIEARIAGQSAAAVAEAHDVIGCTLTQLAAAVKAGAR